MKRLFNVSSAHLGVSYVILLILSGCCINCDSPALKCILQISTVLMWATSVLLGFKLASNYAECEDFTTAKLCRVLSFLMVLVYGYGIYFQYSPILKLPILVSVINILIIALSVLFLFRKNLFKPQKLQINANLDIAPVEGVFLLTLNPIRNLQKS